MQQVPRTKQRLKIVLVGNSGVGKTCLISSYLRHQFDPQSLATVSPTYSSIDVKNSSGNFVCLEIWDTAGQERFHSVSQMFFRNSSIAMICYEAGDKESAKSIPDWIEKVRDESPDCDIFIVITKSDLFSGKEHSLIMKESQQMFASLNPARYFLTSAVSFKGIHELFIAASDMPFQRKSESEQCDVETEPQRKCRC
ncbi:hypothetical protein M9Y10_005442 [Tritrichomonas musculus]|uniref:Small GTP-binding protein n=1 Tax=Tritrichomonas musculus TaxID=1915356 RepID=A0ABR2JMP4_9EUKA